MYKKNSKRFFFTIQNKEYIMRNLSDMSAINSKRIFFLNLYLYDISKFLIKEKTLNFL